MPWLYVVDDQIIFIHVRQRGNTRTEIKIYIKSFNPFYLEVFGQVIKYIYKRKHF